MATALIKGLVDAGTPRSEIVVIEPDAAQRKRLQESLGIEVWSPANERLGAAGVVVWAVKPQMLRQATLECGPHLKDALHISVAAGIRSTNLSVWLASNRVVRAMPNTSALIGAGVTGLTARPTVSKADRAKAERILSAVGYCFWVESDERLDAVTAVTGSGPAYVFHFLEGFQTAAEAIGFDESTARDLVLKTALGAVQQAQSGEAFGALRARVTSKKGTTEAAIAELDQANVHRSIAAAVSAAYDRAGQLARELAAQR